MAGIERPRLTWQQLVDLYNKPGTSVEVARGLVQASTTLQEFPEKELVDFLIRASHSNDSSGTEACKSLARYVLRGIRDKVVSRQKSYPAAERESLRLMASSLVDFYAEHSGHSYFCENKRDREAVEGFLTSCYGEGLEEALVNRDAIELAFLKGRFFDIIREWGMVRLIPRLYDSELYATSRYKLQWQGWDKIVFGSIKYRHFSPGVTDETIAAFRAEVRANCEKIDQDCLNILEVCGSALYDNQRVLAGKQAEVLLALVAKFRHDYPRLN